MSSLAERVDHGVAELRLQEGRDWHHRRIEQAREAGRFASVFSDERTGETRSFTSLIPETVKACEQFELDLPGYCKRAEQRIAIADRLDLVKSRSGWCPRWFESWPTRLRTARKSGCFGVRQDTGQPIVYWDLKAALSRICPDDSREESMRMKRRYVPPIEKLQQEGHAVHFGVFTTPNAKPGKLRDEMQSIFKRLKRVLKLFPEVKGVLAVLEAPLGRERDWNVHLNVILITKGFLDWKRLRAQWHWNVELRKLSAAPGAIAGALTELIKYAVAATPAKSEQKAYESLHREPARLADRVHGSDTQGAPAAASDRSREPVGVDCSGVSVPDAGAPRHGRDPGGRPGEETGAPSHAPAFTEWTDGEIVEWLEAFHAFRRSRGYGCLFGLKDPEPDVGPIVWLGTLDYRGGRYVRSVALLDSIPEDKSHPGDPLAAYQQLRRRLRPPPWPTQGCELTRLAELT